MSIYLYSKSSENALNPKIRVLANILQEQKTPQRLWTY